MIYPKPCSIYLRGTIWLYTDQQEVKARADGTEQAWRDAYGACLAKNYLNPKSSAISLESQP